MAASSVHAKIDTLNFQSDYIGERTVLVWTPDTYNSEESYSVIYAHDGRMLFDNSSTWNGQAWEFPKKLTELGPENKKCILVGIFNAGENRHSEFLPLKVYNTFTKEFKTYLDTLHKANGYKVMGDPVYSDSYLKFIVEELKVQIDKNYSTKPDVSNTFIMGSSMGGLISMYAIFEYPEVFGAAACLSTHWTVAYGGYGKEDEVSDAFAAYIKANIPDPSSHKLYFDYGTETLDSLYERHQLKITKIIEEEGYTKDNFRSLKFEGAAHDEKSWNARLDIPLKFLLSKD